MGQLLRGKPFSDGTGRLGTGRTTPVQHLVAAAGGMVTRGGEADIADAAWEVDCGGGRAVVHVAAREDAGYFALALVTLCADQLRLQEKPTRNSRTSERALGRMDASLEADPMPL